MRSIHLIIKHFHDNGRTFTNIYSHIRKWPLLMIYLLFIQWNFLPPFSLILRLNILPISRCSTFDNLLVIVSLNSESRRYYRSICKAATTLCRNFNVWLTFYQTIYVIPSLVVIFLFDIWLGKYRPCFSYYFKVCCGVLNLAKIFMLLMLSGIRMILKCYKYIKC